MGWYPASPEYKNFPNPPARDITEKVVLLRRAHATGRGTRLKPLPSMGTVSQRKKLSPQKMLVEQARSMGYVNGVYIGRKKR